MYFLAPEEVNQWKELGGAVAKGNLDIKFAAKGMKRNMIPVFYFHCGILLAAEGKNAEAERCFADGALLEQDGIFSNAFIAGFMERHQQKLDAPALCFEDPAPYIHFTTTPQMKESRENFVEICSRSLPDFSSSFKIIDLGTGNGALLVMLLDKLLENGNITNIDEILLVDSSVGMLEVAQKNLSEKFPINKIKVIEAKIQDAVSIIDGHYDVALSSLAFHHMPYADKAVHLKKLKDKIDHFIIFELDADNDQHEVHSPELSLAVYQSYGRMIDFIFQHDAPLPITQTSVDNFLITEEISFMKDPHGVRTDYHMLRNQWQTLFDSVLGPEFSCRNLSDCLGDEYMAFFSLHYGRI